METMMILTVAAIWTAVLATAIAGVYLVRKIGEIEARKLDTVAFEEYLIYSRRKGNVVDISGEIKVRYLGREFQITRIGIDFLNDGGKLEIGAEPVERSE